MKKTSIIVIVIIAILVLIAILIGGSYNSLVSEQEKVESTLSNLDVMLQRRADLIPNLVNTVKGYAKHETEAIEKVTSARERMTNAGTVQEKAKANTELSTSLNSLMVVVENYPELQASSNFRQLSDELAGTENRIAVARKDYNDAVQKFNTSVKKFPKNIIAGMFNFNEKQYFETDSKNMEIPNVSF